MQRARLIGKEPDAWENWRQKKGATEDKTVGWHHWLNGHELELTLEDGEGWGSLLYWSPWGCKESDTTERLNNNKISDARKTKPAILLHKFHRGEKKKAQIALLIAIMSPANSMWTLPLHFKSDEHAWRNLTDCLVKYGPLLLLTSWYFIGDG